MVPYEQSRLATGVLTMVTREDGSRIPTRPTILADGGYAGINNSYPEAATPRRRWLRQTLSDEDREFNRRLAMTESWLRGSLGPERLLGYLKRTAED